MAGIACSDEYFESEKVYGLTDFNFSAFLNHFETILVMFYDSTDDRSVCPSQQFSLAAAQTKRKNHAYAAVDCSKSGYLCSKQDANTTPMFTMFSNGHKLGSISDVNRFKNKMMRSFVETAPVLSEPVDEQTPNRYLPAQFR